MKTISKSKSSNLLLLPFVALTLFLPFIASAFTYRDADLLLVFHKDGYDDIEFNLGSITPLLALTNGTQQSITGWNSSLLTSTYGNDLSDGVKVSLLAATSVDSTNRRVWLTTSDANSKVNDRTPSTWQVLWSKANAIGNQPQNYTQTSSVPYFVASPTLIASYSYIASNGGSQPTLIPTLGGASSVNVEGGVPGELRLYEVKPSSVNPKPEASLVGTFQIDANGNLSFTSGSLPTATKVTRIASETGFISLTFDTVTGLKYRVRQGSQIGVNISSWTTVGDIVTGTGVSATITLPADVPARFYVIESF